VLDRLLDTGKFSESDSICIMRQLMEVLAHLHQNDIVHRDIKPENILLMSRDPKSYDYNRIMICDFGMSQSRPGIETNVLKTMIGTPEFAAPEVMSIARYGCTQGVPGSDKYSCQVDNWAAGCVLYTMLSLSTPFQSNGRTNIPGMIDRILSGKYSFKASVWSSISEDTKGLIKGLICVDPSERFNAKLALQHPALCEVKGLLTPVVTSSDPWGSTICLPVRTNALASNFSSLAQEGTIDQKLAQDESCHSCSTSTIRGAQSVLSSCEAHVAKVEKCIVTISHTADIRLASNDRASCASAADSWQSAAVTEPATPNGLESALDRDSRR
jgi:serine/threonine protein kinase